MTGKQIIKHIHSEKELNWINKIIKKQRWIKTSDCYWTRIYRLIEGNTVTEMVIVIDF